MSNSNSRLSDRTTVLDNSNIKELFGCSHLKIVKFGERPFCQTCGIYRPNTNTRVFRSLRFKYNVFFNPMLLLQKALVPTLPTQQLSAEYLVIRSSVLEFIKQVAGRLTLSDNCVFLAMTYLDKLQSVQRVSELEVHLYACTALMLAAKSNEIDERIPFISKLKRYSSMTNHPEVNYYSVDQFRRAERHLIRASEWNLQSLTLLDRVEYLLSFGVLDDEDTLVLPDEEVQVITGDEPRRSASRVKKVKDLPEDQVTSIIQKIEDKYSTVCLQVIQDPVFSQTEQSTLALSIIGYLRKSCGLMNVWSQHLQSLTDYSATQISSVVSQLMVNVQNGVQIEQRTPVFSPVRSYISTSSAKALQVQNPPFGRATSLLAPSVNSRLNKKNFSFLNINENTHSTHQQVSFLSDKIKTLGCLSSYPLKLSDQNKFSSIGTAYRSFY